MKKQRFLIFFNILMTLSVFPIAHAQEFGEPLKKAFLTLLGVFDFITKETLAAKFLIWLLLFSVLTAAGRKVFGDDNRIGTVVAGIIALMSVTFIPAKMVQLIFQTYSIVAVLILLGGLIFAMIYLSKRLKDGIGADHPFLAHAIGFILAAFSTWIAYRFISWLNEELGRGYGAGDWFNSLIWIPMGFMIWHGGAALMSLFGRGLNLGGMHLGGTGPSRRERQEKDFEKETEKMRKTMGKDVSKVIDEKLGKFVNENKTNISAVERMINEVKAMLEGLQNHTMTKEEINQKIAGVNEELRRIRQEVRGWNVVVIKPLIDDVRKKVEALNKFAKRKAQEMETIKEMLAKTEDETEKGGLEDQLKVAEAEKIDMEKELQEVNEANAEILEKQRRADIEEKAVVQILETIIAMQNALKEDRMQEALSLLINADRMLVELEQNEKNMIVDMDRLMQLRNMIQHHEERIRQLLEYEEKVAEKIIEVEEAEKVEIKRELRLERKELVELRRIRKFADESKKNIHNIKREKAYNRRRKDLPYIIETSTDNILRELNFVQRLLRRLLQDKEILGEKKDEIVKQEEQFAYRIQENCNRLKGFLEQIRSPGFTFTIFIGMKKDIEKEYDLIVGEANGLLRLLGAFIKKGK